MSNPSIRTKRLARSVIGALATAATLVAAPAYAAPIVYELSGSAGSVVGNWTLRLEADTADLTTSVFARQIISTSGTFTDQRGTFVVTGGQFGLHCEFPGDECNGVWSLVFRPTGSSTAREVWERQRLDPQMPWDLTTPIDTSYIGGATAKSANEFRVDLATLTFAPGTPGSFNECVGNPCDDLYDGSVASARRLVVTSAVPLPATAWLLLSAFAGLGIGRRSRGQS